MLTRKIITKIFFLNCYRYFYLVIVLAPVDGGGPGRPVAGRLVLRPQRRSHAAVFSGAGADTANCLILSFYNLLSQIITPLSHRTQGFCTVSVVMCRSKIQYKCEIWTDESGSFYPILIINHHWNSEYNNSGVRESWISTNNTLQYNSNLISMKTQD